MKIANILLLAMLTLITQFAHAEKLPEQFVYLSDIDPSILQELRYAGKHNFIGRPIAGYKSNECMLTRSAAAALKAAQADLKKSGYALKVYDCYRPQKAVDDFIAWSKQPARQEMKTEFYPQVNKADFFKLGYVAEKSGHTRGSTVDITMVALAAPHTDIDMGTTYDYMDELSHSNNQAINKTAYKNRQLLYWVMEKYDFVNLPTEWWHFTLKNEPYNDKYFNSDIRPKLPTTLSVPSHSKQLVVVRANSLDTFAAQMQRYERRSTRTAWMAVGETVPVVIGKNGLAITKREGDLRTPIGVYQFGSVFGFAQHEKNINMPYQPLAATSVCIDDPTSRYYNQLLDQAAIKQPDWHSAEHMRTTASYKIGAVIAYNDKREVNAGSCIFMHIWKSSDKGTAGCVAMAEPALALTLSWLNPAKRPVVAIFKN